METELARTFLTVVTAGSFVTASETLHVSQSTVSTRIQIHPRIVSAHLTGDIRIASAAKWEIGAFAYLGRTMRCGQ